MKKLISISAASLVIYLGVNSALAQEADISLGLAERVDGFYTWALGMGAVLALAIIIYGGVLYSASAGNPSRIEEAKTWIQHALFGLGILLSAFLILNTINPDLTRLEEIFVAENPVVEGPGLPAGIKVGDLVGEIIPPNLGGVAENGYYQLPPSENGAYTRGVPDASCGKIELIGVINYVANEWQKDHPESPLVVRDLNGGILNSGVNHQTHDMGVDVDIDVSALNNAERIELAKLFIDTGIVTGMIHSNLGVMYEVNNYFRINQTDLTAWKGGDFMRWLDDSAGEPTHTSHFHIRIGDGDGAAGTGISPGVCNTSCSRNTTCNPNTRVINAV